MSDPTWLSITGAITGIIGAVTGIAGAIMGYIAYRHSKQLKALDLRLELQRQGNDVRRLTQSLPAHLEYAKKSHCAVASALGNFKSGAMEKWLADWDGDLATAQAIINRTPIPSKYTDLEEDELEENLVAIHALHGDAQHLQSKYEKTIADDDQRRAELRAAQNARHAPTPR